MPNILLVHISDIKFILTLTVTVLVREGERERGGLEGWGGGVIV